MTCRQGECRSSIRHRIIKNVDDARFYINDCNAYEWPLEGETLRVVVHVDDVLFAVSGEKIRSAFVSKLAAAFEVTEGIEEATEFCSCRSTVIGQTTQFA